MEQYYKTLKRGLMLIAITLVIGVGINLYLHLDEPVVLKSYMDIRYHDSEEVQLRDAVVDIRYITNITDNRTVNRIEFPEIPGLSGYISQLGGWSYDFFNGININNGERYGRYKIVSAFIQLHINNTDNMKGLEKGFTLTEAEIFFNDGTTLNADIGEINFFNDMTPNIELNMNENGELSISDKDMEEQFEHRSSSSSSDGTGRSRFRIKEDIELLEVKGELLDKFKNYIEITVDGEDYRNISGKIYEEDDYINIETEINIWDNPEMKLYEYDLRPELIYRDKAGRVYTRRLYIDHRGRYSINGFMDIVRFLRARGEI